MTSLINETVTALNRLTSGIEDPEQWLVDALGGGTQSAGVTVNYHNVKGLPGVWSSVSLIAGHMGSLPIEVRRKTSTGSEVIEGHVSVRVQNTPNPWYQTGGNFRETLMEHALISGNGRAFILRNSLGQPVELWPMWPESTWTQMVDGEKWHMFTTDQRYIPPDHPLLPSYAYAPNETPQMAGATYKMKDTDVLHIPGLSYYGLWGDSVIGVLKDVFGIDKAGQDQSASAFENGGHPGLVFETPEHELREQKDAKEWFDWIKQEYQGPKNALKMMMMRNGMKLHTVAISNADAQFLEQRRFSQEDVWQIFGTQHMLGDSKAVYKDLSQRMTAYVTNTLGRWVRKWEEECDRKLLSGRERAQNGRIYHKFDLSSLLRGDPNTLADYTGKLFQQKCVTPNEIRELHKLNRLPGLDEVPSNEPPEPAAGPPESPQAPPQEQENNRAQLRHFENLIDNEVDRVIRAAKNEDDFTQWLVDFYRAQQKRYTDVCSDIGTNINRAEDYCSKSFQELYDLAGCSGANLPDVVKAKTRTWRSRANEFIG